MAAGGGEASGLQVQLDEEPKALRIVVHTREPGTGAIKVEELSHAYASSSFYRVHLGWLSWHVRSHCMGLSSSIL